MYRMQGVLVLMTVFVCLADSFSWDFVVSRHNKLEFYNEGTIAYATTPTAHRIEWIIYDPVHDRVLFSDRGNNDNSVSSFVIATKNTQSLIKKKPDLYLTRVAYDPVTELLFGTFVNKIYSFSLKPGNNNEVNGDLVMNLELVLVSTRPREVAADSCGGYIYWTSNNIIERAKFNGSDREVIIDRGITVKKGLTIDTERIYWIESQEYNDGSFCIESADLNGKNRRTLYCERQFESSPDKLTLSKDVISWWDSTETAFIWQLPKNSRTDGIDVKPNKISMTSTSDGSVCGSQDISPNYKIQERTQGAPNCHALKSLLPGYIDLSICQNYCYKGDCYFSAEGQPKCRCYSGYSGERCAVDSCYQYCLNDGVCTLNNDNEPVCQCTGQYEGKRCADLPVILKPAPPKKLHEKLHWLPIEGDKLPSNALHCGDDTNDIYVARADISGSLCPGKYDNSLGTGLIPWGGVENRPTRKETQILCGINARWVRSNPNRLPQNAFIGGRTGSPTEKSGDPLYVCRVMIDGKYTCGKAYVPHNACYFPYNGREEVTSLCDILVEADDEI